MATKASDLAKELSRWRESLEARLPTPNPHFDPQKQDLLDPHGEAIRREYLPIPWPPSPEAVAR
jgi:hypothetical protein